jgi:hypothetical protein
MKRNANRAFTEIDEQQRERERERETTGDVNPEANPTNRTRTPPSG